MRLCGYGLRVDDGCRDGSRIVGDSHCRGGSRWDPW